MTTSPFDGLPTMARMAGGIDVDHPPAPSGLSDDPRSHCAYDPEVVDPAVERREDEGLHGGRVSSDCWGSAIPAVERPSRGCPT